MQVENSVVLINSAGTVLGRHLAQHFAHHPTTLVLVDEDTDALCETLSAVSGHQATCMSYVLVDQSQQSINGLFEQIESALGRGVDILVNNLESAPLPYLASPDGGEEFAKKLAEFTTKLYGFSHASAMQMQKNNVRGVIVNVISHCTNNSCICCDSVPIINSLTKHWARELHPYHIRVGSVIPGDNQNELGDNVVSLSKVRHEMIRNTEYVVANDFFNGRVVSS